MKGPAPEHHTPGLIGAGAGLIRPLLDTDLHKLLRSRWVLLGQQLDLDDLHRELERIRCEAGVVAGSGAGGMAHIDGAPLDIALPDACTPLLRLGRAAQR